MLKRQRQQIPLKNAQPYGRVASQLHDLLPAAIFARESAKPRNHRGQQLHHDRCADVRHDAQREDCAIFQRATTEQVKQRCKATSGTLAKRGAKPLLQYSLVDSGGCDRRS
jgi:hypothetical protein